MIAGRYTLEREIGRGGMGAVWLGRDEVLGRAVALKRVGSLPGGTGPDLARAEREARLAARLSHSHVVAVFDLVTAEDAQWLVMEYVAGTNFAEVIRSEGALPPERVSPVIQQAADALAAAHAAGIVHRDVKPSNILVTPDGQVKLSDFGIARAEADPSLTQTGLVTGSPAYLAPEVAAGNTATAASDVWSLGATTFHALAGHPPYAVGDNVLGAMYRIVHEEPPRLADAGWLGDLLEHSMTRDPADRWSMAQVRDFLVAGPPPPRTGRRRRGGPVPASTPLPSPDTTPAAAQPSAPDPDSTRALPRETTAAAPARPPVPPPAQPAPPRSTGGDRQRRPVWLPILVALGVAAVVAVIALVVLLGGDPSPTTPEAGESDSPTASSTSPSAEQADAEEMEAFIRDYLDTAASRPRQAFDRLTPAFQAESGGLDGYLNGFWGNVRRIDSVTGVSADPEDLTVGYTYTYTLRNGSSRTEDISLQLEYADGEYLIAGPA